MSCWDDRQSDLEFISALARLCQSVLTNAGCSGTKSNLYTVLTMFFTNCWFCCLLGTYFSVCEMTAAIRR